MARVLPMHPTQVEGYEERLQILSERIHGMRYDKVAEFYGDSTIELRRQAEGDRLKGRYKLVALLEQAAFNAELQKELFLKIFSLCESHMKDES